MSKFNYLEVSEEVKEKAKNCAEKAGYTFDSIMRYSNHPSDDYLYVVVGKGGYSGGYIVWIFNSTSNYGEGSLGNGTYDLTFVNMLKRLSEVVRDVED